jgi:glycosyltransferase involved in cell wall biosynthesis
VDTLPKVSVIIPLYNREKYIAETVQSVLSQTYPNIELIVVDDGSTDNSRQVLDQFGSQLILLEHTDRLNKGQSATINLGLLHAIGKYVAILDSDDLFAPEKIRTQVEYLENKNDIGLVYSNGYYIYENGRKPCRFYDQYHEENSNPAKVLLNCYFALPTNALIRRAVFDKTGFFDENLRSGQDHDMAIRVAEVTKLAYIDKMLFFYRRHTDSISVKSADLRWRNGFIILYKAKQRYPYSPNIIRKRRAVLNFRLGQIDLENKHYFKATMHFIVSGILNPLRAIRVVIGKEGTGGLH